MERTAPNIAAQADGKPRRRRIGMRKRILFPLVALTLIALAGALVTIWYTSEARGMLNRIIDQDLEGLRAAEELSAGLSMQKGYATYFFLSGDEAHLRDLEEHTVAFEAWLDRAQRQTFSPESRALLRGITTNYQDYKRDRTKVITMYAQGRHKEGSALHWDVRSHFSRLAKLALSLKNAQEHRIKSAVTEARRKGALMIFAAWAAMSMCVVLAVLLSYVLFHQVLTPIRRLAREGAPSPVNGDEIEALDKRVHGLMDDVDKAREHVMQAEKLALAGKLAAGVAHSVRNPLTSVKMRLFSLGRSLRFDVTQAEDFEVISEEVAHIDTILGHFLEFARPPMLRTEPVDLGQVVEHTVCLLRHRLDSYGVAVEFDLADVRLVRADPERLKEVLVNLLLNACEAMPGGGKVAISTRPEPTASNHAVHLEVRDWGPGAPERVLSRLFEPFFSTKEDGSGLGLAIARRIMLEHDGAIDVVPGDGCGLVFKLVLPCEDK